MRILTKIKLINWHYFINETISIDGDTLVTGDNGAGKSTLIDALQVVMIGNLSKVRFNSAAMKDRTTRDIRSYLRGKTGAEGKSGFLRDYDFSSYIVLEITHTTSNKPYLIGVVFDYYHATGEEEHVFFRLDEEYLQDDLFFKGPREPRNRREFFDYLKAKGIKYKHYHNDINRYIYDLKQLFGGVKDSFFSLFTKGISFTPITNLRSFVYEYILEEKTLDVATMKEYFERFRQVEEMIDETKREMAELENIESIYQEINKMRETLQVNDYMVRRGYWEHKKEIIGAKEQERDALLTRQKELWERIEEAEEQKEGLEKNIEELAEAMRENEAKQKEERLSRELEQLRAQLGELEKMEKNLVHKLKVETDEIDQLLGVLQHLEAPVELTRPLLEAKDRWLSAISSEGKDFPEDTAGLAEAWGKVMDWVKTQNDRWENEERELAEEEKRLEEVIANLEKNRVLGPESSTVKLKEVLEEQLFDPEGGKVPVHIFCEAIDIKNEKWRNAIEGYLHTQKFDLLVPPNYFDEALSLYERHKFTLGIERVGLVNTGRLLEESRVAQEDSLAEEITAQVNYVAAYANWLLGGLIKCEREQELKQYARAITDSCMLYQNYTARQIPHSRYETPYIGEEAIKTQLQRNRDYLNDVQLKRRGIKDKIQSASTVKSLSLDKRDRYQYLQENSRQLQEKDAVSAKMREVQEELMSLDISEYKRLEQEHQEKKRSLNDLVENMRKMDTEKGELSSKVKNAEEEIDRLGEESKEHYQNLQQLESQFDEGLRERCAQKWEKEAKEKKPEVLRKNYSSSWEGINTSINNKMQSLIKARTEYCHRFNFPEDPEKYDNEPYRQRYYLLVDSHLQDYEEQAREAREKAEQSFQEHFIARLGEYIKQAEEEIKELNRALKDMRFGTDTYRFSLTARQETKRYYDMITDTGVYQGSIFRDAFYDKHGDAIKDLFYEIVNKHDDLSQAMHSLTDYRTYLDFEIKITDEQGNQSNFSQVARDKSGGETQVPFYVAILASFYQAYQLYRKSDTLRLVVFDEAFNNMDADRIEEAIRFMQNLGFQAIIVALTGRIQLIVPHVNTNLVVMREGYHSFIERVTRKELTD